jgi:hypothetical protein
MTMHGNDSSGLSSMVHERTQSIFQSRKGKRTEMQDQPVTLTVIPANISDAFIESSNDAIKPFIQTIKPKQLRFGRSRLRAKLCMKISSALKLAMEPTGGLAFVEFLS